MLPNPLLCKMGGEEYDSGESTTLKFNTNLPFLSINGIGVLFTAGLIRLPMNPERLLIMNMSKETQLVYTPPTILASDGGDTQYHVCETGLVTAYPNTQCRVS